MSSSLGGNILYYIPTIFWILAWALIAIAAGVAAARTGRKIYILVLVFAALTAVFNIAHHIMIDPHFGMLSYGSSYSSSGYDGYMLWFNIYSVASLVLFLGFSISLALSLFTAPRRPREMPSSFPVEKNTAQPLQQQRVP